VKCHAKTSGEHTHDEKTSEINAVEILGIKKQVRNTEILSKIAGDHSKQQNPAQHQHDVSSDIVKKQLNRERIEEFGKKQIKLSHRQNSTSSYAKLIADCCDKLRIAFLD
jgi:hypothetical protein